MFGLKNIVKLAKQKFLSVVPCLQKNKLFRPQLLKFCISKRKTIITIIFEIAFQKYFKSSIINFHFNLTSSFGRLLKWS